MSDLEEEYFLDYFKNEGFFRRECEGCGVFFWTRSESRHKCGESPCEEYGFIGSKHFVENISLYGSDKLSGMISNGISEKIAYKIVGKNWLNFMTNHF